jgi:hypothetical protein
MIRIVNTGLTAFIEKTKYKKLFIWGAGVRTIRFLEECDITDNLIAVIDNDKDKIGQLLHFADTENVEIIDYKKMASLIQCFGIENTILLIAPLFGVPDIITQLNEIQELDNLQCYLGELIMNYYEKQQIKYNDGELIIPKKIHYCWFGKNELPFRLQKCIDSWSEKCPDYEIIRWDESNYDITKNRYMREAYENKKWGFVPDYARLDIIYNEGGIYLDTDVELLKNLDIFLADEMFCGFDRELSIAMGLGFGAVKNYPFMKNLRDEYDNVSFCNEDGSFNKNCCIHYQNPIFKSYGFSLRNNYQKIKGIVVYPSEVFCPKGSYGALNNFTENTVAIHHGTLSWETEKQKNDFIFYRQFY